MSTRESGFTLLELLVVVAIIGILATLAIANYSMFKGQAINATAASDARAIAPAADFASDPERFAIPLDLPLDGTGGFVDVVWLPGATYSPGTFGLVHIPAPNQYVITTHQGGGDLCYTIDNQSSTGMTVGPFPCT